MSSGKYQSSPILVINLAGEMLYIIYQRLQVGSSPKSKILSIMDSITSAVFNQLFIEELLLNNCLLSTDFLRQLFRKLAQSSIMKLNEPSFRKLFDLMIMNVKLQIVSTSSPLELYPLTINHLEGVRKIVSGGESVKCLDYTTQKFRQKYRHLKFGRYLEIKLQLLNRLKYNNARVTMFIENQYQDKETGYLSLYRRYAPHTTSPVGTVLYDNFKEELYIGERQIKYNQFESKEFHEWKSQLGLNVYEGYLPLKGFSSEKYNFVSRQSKTTEPPSQTLKPNDFKKQIPFEVGNFLPKTLIITTPNDEQVQFTLDMFQQDVTTSNKSKPISQVVGKAIPQSLSTFKESILSDLQTVCAPAQDEDDLTQLMDKAMRI